MIVGLNPFPIFSGITALCCLFAVVETICHMYFSRFLVFIFKWQEDKASTSYSVMATNPKYFNINNCLIFCIMHLFFFLTEKMDSDQIKKFLLWHQSWARIQKFTLTIFNFRGCFLEQFYVNSIFKRKVDRFSIYSLPTHMHGFFHYQHLHQMVICYN